MSGVPKFFKDDVEYYAAWNDVADEVEAEEPVDTSVQLEMAI